MGMAVCDPSRWWVCQDQAMSLTTAPLPLGQDKGIWYHLGVLCLLRI